MNKVDRYKKMFAVSGENENMEVSADGKVHVPVWLMMLVLHSSGLRSKKKRLVKKRLKREVTKLIQNYVENE
jgi:hypothetical protein